MNRRMIMPDTATSMSNTDASLIAGAMTVVSRLSSRLLTRSRYAHLQRLTKTGQFVVGRHTYGLPTIYASHPDDRVEIGAFCSLGPGLTLIPGSNHPLEHVSTFPLRRRWALESIDSSARRSGPIRIGHDVWIGSNVTVLSGVSIGTGAVVAAGSIVAKDVPPYAVWAGVPAEHLKSRFTGNTAERLLSSGWWELPDSVLREVAPLLESDRVDEFLSALNAPTAPFSQETTAE